MMRSKEKFSRSDAGALVSYGVQILEVALVYGVLAYLFPLVNPLPESEWTHATVVFCHWLLVLSVLAAVIGVLIALLAWSAYALAGAAHRRKSKDTRVQ